MKDTTRETVTIDENHRIRSVRLSPWSQALKTVVAKAPLNWRLLVNCASWCSIGALHGSYSLSVLDCMFIRSRFSRLALSTSGLLIYAVPCDFLLGIPLAQLFLIGYHGAQF